MSSQILAHGSTTGRNNGFDAENTPSSQNACLCRPSVCSPSWLVAPGVGRRALVGGILGFHRICLVSVSFPLSQYAVYACVPVMLSCVLMRLYYCCSLPGTSL